MAALDRLKNYSKQHVTIEGPNGVYVGKELDAVGQSVKNVNDALTALFGSGLALTELAAQVTGTFLGNISGSDAAPIALTATQVTANLNVFTATLKGLVPAPTTSTGKVLKDDATWYTIPAYALTTNNGSDFTNFATFRSNIGLVIGTDVLAYDAQLTSNIRQVISNANLTLDLTHGEKHIYHTDTSAYTWTIPANSSVAYPVGTAITFVNDGTGAITLAITTDTLVWSSSGTTGSRTLAQYGMATAIKVTSTRWFISGSGLT